MVRLVWFPGYVDWERRNYTWEIRGQTRTINGNGSWRKIPVTPKLKHITAGGDDEVFGVTDKDQLVRCKKPCIGSWEGMGVEMSQCDASIDLLYGVNTTGTIYIIQVSI